MQAADRIGWWLAHPDPRGDDAAAVAARIRAFACSLLDAEPQPDDLFVGITHSPILRAVALGQEGRDPGEPRHLTGLLLRIDRASLDVATFDPFTKHPEDTHPTLTSTRPR